MDRESCDDRHRWRWLGRGSAAQRRSWSPPCIKAPKLAKIGREGTFYGAICVQNWPNCHDFSDASASGVVSWSSPVPKFPVRETPRNSEEEAPSENQDWAPRKRCARRGLLALRLSENGRGLNGGVVAFHHLPEAIFIFGEDAAGPVGFSAVVGLAGDGHDGGAEVPHAHPQHG